MRWLLHGKFDPSVGDALRAHGHQVLSLTDAGLSEDADADMVLSAAQKGQLDLLTADSDIANRPFAGPDRLSFNRCIALINDGENPEEAVERFFTRYPRPSPGRLYTITHSRVKVRQLPNQK